MCVMAECPFSANLLSRGTREGIPKVVDNRGERTGDGSVSTLLTAIPLRGRGAKEIHEAIPPATGTDV
jgi:hypothetical protein